MLCRAGAESCNGSRGVQSVAGVQITSAPPFRIAWNLIGGMGVHPHQDYMVSCGVIALLLCSLGRSLELSRLKKLNEGLLLPTDAGQASLY